MPAAAPTWTGFYIGGNLGAAWEQAHTDGTGVYSCCFNNFPISNSTTHTGFIGGGQIGYNWQNGNAVYGLEADISGLGGSGSVTQPYGNSFNGKAATTTNKIDWLATFRGRLGLAVNNSLVYATAGLAVGRVNNSFTTNDAFIGGTSQWTDHSTRTGLAVGGGVEEMLTPNWTVRLEGLFVDLGRKTVPVTSTTVPAFTGINSFSATFSNQAVIGRVGLNYKF